MAENRTLYLYEKHGGLLRGHFLLSSGLHSDVYLQSEKVMMHPNAAEEVVYPLNSMLSDYGFNTVVSPAIGGIRFGYELARQMGKRAVFTERIGGGMTFRRGFSLEKGEPVIVAEDVVTTGKSTHECIQAVRDAGGEVVCVVSLIDRSGGSADFDVPFVSLARIDVNVWEKSSCPLCSEGGKAVKPGSRDLID